MNVYDTIKTLNIEQFKSAENFNKVLKVASSTFNELNIVFSDLKSILNIANASSKQLDLIGSIVVESREGRNDDDYRSAIIVKILKNTSRGFVEDIVDILTVITNANKVVYSDNPPASYTIYTNGNVLPATLNKIIDKLSSAGVSVVVYASDNKVPFIAIETVTGKADLVTENSQNVIDDAGSQIVASYTSSILSDALQEIFGGIGFGVVKTLILVTNTGDTLVTNTGAIIGCYDENQTIIDGGLANLSYQ